MSVWTRALTADDQVAGPGWLFESPVWDHRRDLLVWVDIDPGQVHTFHPSSGATARFDIGRPVTAVALRQSGGYLLSLERYLVSCDGGFRVLGELAVGDDMAADVRFNDGAAAPDGSFWIGSLSHDRDGAGALYRLPPQGAVAAAVDRNSEAFVLSPVLDGVSISNGMDWSLDGSDHFYVDSGAGTVDVLHTGPAAGPSGWQVTARSTLVSFPSGTSPDGLTVDAEGGIWVALWGGGRVVRLSRDGSVTAEITLPAPHVSSVAFGGTDLTDLYITTAREGLDAAALAAAPLSGSLFRCHAGVRGRRAFSWQG